MKSTKNKRMTVVCVLLAMILFSGAIFALVSAPVKADSFSEDDMPSLEKVFYYSDNRSEEHTLNSSHNNQSRMPSSA